MGFNDYWYKEKMNGFNVRTNSYTDKGGNKFIIRTNINTLWISRLKFKNVKGKFIVEIDVQGKNIKYWFNSIISMIKSVFIRIKE